MAKKINRRGTACSAPTSAGPRRARRIRRVTAGPAGTAALAERFARCLPPGTVVFLEGPLGAGKTVFVRGMARAFGLDPQAVHSPSFLLMHDYGGMVHIDCYRLQEVGGDALVEAGLWEALEGESVKAVEWPPPELRRRFRKALRVRLRFAEGNRRIIELPEMS